MLAWLFRKHWTEILQANSVKPIIIHMGLTFQQLFFEMEKNA